MKKVQYQKPFLLEEKIASDVFYCLEQACTTYGPQAACGPRKLFLRPAKAFLAARESFLKCRKC